MAPVNPKSLLKMLAGKSKENPKGGVADTVAAQIDGQAPAALSAGEYVIPADVVALIGDGNTDAGVEVLDSAIAELRKAKTGKKDQPNPMAELFSGGKVKAKHAYAEGGKVKKTVKDIVRKVEPLTSLEKKVRDIVRPIEPLTSLKKNSRDIVYARDDDLSKALKSILGVAGMFPAYASGGKVAETVNKNQKIAPPTEPPNGPSLSAIIQRLVGGIA